MIEDNFFKVIKADLSRLDKPSFANFIKHYIFPKGEVFRYIFWLRVVEFSKKRKITKYILGGPSYLIMRHYEYKYGIHVNTNIVIGKGLHIVHGGTVYLNCKSIGENVTIYQGVTLGANHDDQNIPTIKDNVTIYTGAVVVGNIVLENNCKVGANAFVNHNVYNNTTVVGIPAKEI